MNRTLLLLAFFGSALAVSAQQPRFFRILSYSPTAIISCAPDGHVTWTNASPGVICTVQTATVLAPGNWEDYVQVAISNHTTTHRIFDPCPPTNMSFIPGGNFVMGGVLDPTGDSLPVHSVHVSPFYMDRYEVTKALWDLVYGWAVNHGYTFESAPQGKAKNHPMYRMSWYDAVKWCNARSEMEAKPPAYFTDVALTQPYRTGEKDPYVNWNSGYRLPTEAEWEKAARGGAYGHRFPWSDTDTITHSRANYYAGVDPYDLSPTLRFHPAFDDGVEPYTSPVGYFVPNGYGLYDMAGNLWEWCWDWYGRYSSSANADPRGASTGLNRVQRGGCWYGNAGYATVSERGLNGPSAPDSATYMLHGFRTVLPVL
jgi:formylglycine-generating enzyme